MKYAGFWIRFWASLVDCFITMLVIVLLAASTKLGWVNAYDEGAVAGIGYIAIAVLGWFYFAFFESGRWQATPGKRLVGIRVTDLDGNRISFGRATGRYFAKWLSGLIFYIGYIMAGITDKKQGLHDKLADTFVMRGNAEEETPEYAAGYTAADSSEQTVYVPQTHADSWVMSGFDANGDVVRLSFKQDSPQLRNGGMVIGRDAKSCDLHMSDLSVSRRHARLLNENGTVWLEDLDSANGTLVNGRVLKSGVAVELPRQGTVTFGAVELSIAKY
jgi:uncharacterized RDD family membrane protein YckC